MITVLESHPSSHHFPSPLLLTPPHTTPHYHFSSLPSLLLASSHHSPSPHYSSLFPPLYPLITPLTTPHHPSPPLLTTLSHPHLTHPPHYTSLPPSSPLPSLPTFLTTPPHHSFTTLSPPPHPHPLPLLPRPHHSLKGHNNTKKLVKSPFPMPINLCRTFLSLKTSFLIILCKKNFGTKSTKSWNMTAAAARTC